MRLLKSALVACVAMTALSSMADNHNSMDNPMTRAIMESYDSMLKDNPADYQVYFRRANEYYKYDRYAKALADINAAIENCPAKEKDIRFQCYELRASVYERMKMYDEAINDLNSALALDPNSYAALYQKANAEYETGRYADAKADYRRLQGLNPRSREALFGLARIAVVEKDYPQAIKYADDAVALTPSDPDVFMERASILAMTGNRTGAVENYIAALTLSKSGNLSRPLQALVDMSYTDYNATVGGLRNAITASPREGILYYIRGIIAKAHFHYPDAVNDFCYIIDNYLLDHPGIYRALAECHYALANYDRALSYIDTAIGSTADNLDAYAVKSDIKRAIKSYRQAVTAADRALEKDAKFAPALFAKGLALLYNNLVTEASTALGSAVLERPDDPLYLLTRGWVLAEYMDQPENAASYFNDMLRLEGYPDNRVESLRGFALLRLGRTAEAAAWMQAVLDARAATPAAPALYQGDGLAEYYATCFYAMTGNIDRAFDCMETSLRKGYANYHNWTDGSPSPISLDALRSDPRFNNLLTTYIGVFAVG